MIQMLDRILRKTTRRIPVPRYRTPDVKKALVLAPHMDDDVVGCGGTMRLLADKGCEFHIIYVTNGCRGNSDMQWNERLAEVRKTEAKAAVDYLIGEKCSGIFHLDLEDGNVLENRKEPDILQQLLIKEEYDGIFVPYALDIHPDHRAANYMLFQTLKKAQPLINSDIYFYEVWVPLIPNLMVDITSCFQDKCHAMRLHKSQTEVRQYETMIRSLNGFRACFADRQEIQQVEAFYRCSIEEYTNLVNEIQCVLPDICLMQE